MIDLIHKIDLMSVKRLNIHPFQEEFEVKCLFVWNFIIVMCIINLIIYNNRIDVFFLLSIILFDFIEPTFQYTQFEGVV